MSTGESSFGERGRSDFGLAVMGNLLKELNAVLHYQYQATATTKTVMTITFSRYFDDGRILRGQVEDWMWLPALE